MNHHVGVDTHRGRPDHTRVGRRVSDILYKAFPHEISYWWHLGPVASAPRSLGGSNQRWGICAGEGEGWLLGTRLKTLRTLHVDQVGTVGRHWEGGHNTRNADRDLRQNR